MVILAAGLVLQACGKPTKPEAAKATAPADRAAAAPEPSASVSLIAPGFERAAAGPTHLFHLRGDLFGIVDPLAGKIVFVTVAGKPAGAVALPQDFVVRDVDLGEGVILVGQSKGGEATPLQIDVPKDLNLDGAARLVARPATPPHVQVSRDGDGLQLTLQGPSPASLAVRPAAGRQVVSATYLGADAEGRRYVYWEEATALGTAVTARVARFGPKGPEASATIDLKGFAAVPALPVAIDDAGRVLLLQTNNTSIALAEAPLASGSARSAPKPHSIGTVPSEVLDYGDVETPPPAAASARASTTPVAPLPAAESQAILDRSRTMLRVAWTMQPQNYSHPAIENRCAKQEHKYWRRPARYAAGDVGKPQNGLPYKWGGFDDAAAFQSHVAAPRNQLAGDVCTCREAVYNQCIVGEAAGVDCSGFVSRAWGLSSHTGTSSLASVSRPLRGLADLRPGDALNRAGSHVRLFIGFEPGPQMRLRTRESAVSCGGVCEQVYTPAQLVNYRPIRRR